MKYKRIEQGNRFGRLTCKERAKESGFGGATWRCSCECGAETYVSEAMLLSGVIRSCGCKSGRTINLQSERFGMLTVLEPVPERAADGSVRWLCRCECGNYVTLSTNKLNMGRSTSCGCNMGVRAREAKTYIDGTCVEIMMSDTVSKNNTSGYRGVAKNETNGRHTSIIAADGFLWVPLQPRSWQRRPDRRRRRKSASIWRA